MESINDYTLTKKLSENTYEAEKIEYSKETGEKITTKFIIKKTEKNSVIEKLLKLSKNYLSEKLIQRVIDQFYFENNYYIVSEFVEGDQLSFNYSENQLINIINQMADIINYIHANGIVHQNIKPSNFILKNNHLKLIDFSMACDDSEDCMPVVTTEYYCPPEIFNNSKPTFAERKAHDIWSAGAVLFQISNKGENYIDFDSHDSISKDIQLKPPKESRNSYLPINEIIKVMLQPIDSRINAGQFVMLSSLSRPGCEIDDTIYTRTESISILVSKGILVPEYALDSEIAILLTEHVNNCQLKDTKYSREELLNIAKILMKKDYNISTKELCDMLNKTLEYDKESAELAGTDHLIKLITLLADLKLMKDPKFEKIEKIYNRDYKTIKNLGLIDLGVLKDVQSEYYTFYKYYLENKLQVMADNYKYQNNKIISILLDFNTEDFGSRLIN